jgi:DinB superfamily
MVAAQEHAMDRSLIEQYAAGASHLRASIQGLSRAQLTAFPIPGTWSIAQIVVHVWDSDAAATHRMKRIAAEDKPLIIAYDETAFTKALHYHDMDLSRVCTLFEENRHHTAELLRLLPDAAFDRQGIHNHRGVVTLGGLVQGYVDHLEHHLGFVTKKRGMVGG